MSVAPIFAVDGAAPAPLLPLTSAIQCAFAKGVAPLAIEDCSGGAYFLRSASHRLEAIFKPSDEEPFAPHTPKPPTSPEETGPMRAGIPLGEMALRECMAYLVDDERLARVPPTALATGRHKAFHSRTLKRGSVQLYVPHDCASEDLGPAQFPITDVHAIALLDLRLVNQDRHPGNILVQRTAGNRLIPIDHGCVLPEYDAMGETQLTWLHWPQARQPLSATTKAYVARLNATTQLQSWRRQYPNEVFPTKAAVTLHLGTAFVQLCVARGLNVYEMGRLQVRDELDVPSTFECVVEAAVHDLGRRAPPTHVSELLGCFQRRLETALRMEFPAYFLKAPRFLPLPSPKNREKVRKSPVKVLLSSAA
ncbi:hypothetical protein SDRG_02915 [Saprolegnia diclina VS20]|uniref:PI3K/PI4K catalytic domain-containing protein n=1 Tax=Saprolegnia diclina (strain VS20) TaxID=1156394 RepID=T0S9P4_SAPDV|nr:hypothetical protein SDRG_02915 [Saprolegnia diclina VS20]EQC39472.1 hypothetical protein SDRG_02915 [Saprolegnia diclina VS20]|eukprot:XP_008606744.1 hypothetical protein SDRG_02915 [Saprolegnia diclina VS20]